MTYRFYKRVSTKDQSLERQQVAFTAFMNKEGIKPREVAFYQDQATGANVKRQGFQQMMADLQKGDTIVIQELDRLGRNVREMHETLYQINKKGATIKILDLPMMETSDDSLNFALNQMILTLFGYLAEKERKTTLERTRQGREVAKAQGKLTGRPKALSPTGSKRNEYFRTIDLYKQGLTGNQIAEAVGISRRSVYYVIQQAKANGDIADPKP